MAHSHPVTGYVSRAPRSEPPLTGSVDSHRPPRRLNTPRVGPHSGRSGSPRTDSERATDCAARHTHAHAVRAAELGVRAILEVVDGRRAASRLGPIVTPGVTSMVASLTTAAIPGRRLGVARPGRMHLQLVSPDVAEVVCTYSRGERVFALAGRLDRGRTDGRWTVTAVRLS